MKTYIKSICQYSIKSAYFQAKILVNKKKYRYTFYTVTASNARNLSKDKGRKNSLVYIMKSFSQKFRQLKNTLMYIFSHRFFPYIFLVCLAALPFLHNIHDTFLSDDWDFLRIVSTEEYPLSHYFLSNYTGTHEGGSYRPMVNVFWTIGYNLFGFESEGFHILMIALHAANTILLFSLLKHLPFLQAENRKWFALVAATIFASLPNHSEPVIWIASANDLLATFFSLLSLWFLTRTLDAQKRVSQVLLYAFSLIVFGAALLSKESSFTLPLISIGIVFFTLLKQKGLHQRWIKLTLVLPYFLLVLLYFFLRSKAIGLLASYYGGSLHFDIKNIILSEVHLLLSHIVSTELRLSLAETFLQHIAIFASVFIIFATLFALSIFKKKQWEMLFFILAYLASTIPVISFIIDHNKNYPSSEGERWAYLPSIFFSCILASIFFLIYNQFQKRKILRSLIIVLGITCLAFWYGILFQKNALWHAGAKLADQTLVSMAEEQKKHTFDGAVIIGVPDSYRGVYLFRNMYPFAFTQTTGMTLDMIITPSKTLYEKDNTFTITRAALDTFLYAEQNNKKIISTAAEFSSLDYDGFAEDIERQNGSTNAHTTASSWKIVFRPAFMQSNEKRRIGIFFFDHGNWQVRSLY